MMALFGVSAQAHNAFGKPEACMVLLVEQQYSFYSAEIRHSFCAEVKCKLTPEWPMVTRGAISN